MATAGTLERGVNNQYQIENFLFGSKGILNFRRRADDRQPYTNEQYLGWAFSELGTAVKFGVRGDTWPNKDEKVKNSALEIAEDKFPLIEWAVREQNYDKWLNSKALELARRLAESGTEDQKRRALDLLRSK